jgi:hypothetical protein
MRNNNSIIIFSMEKKLESSFSTCQTSRALTSIYLNERSAENRAPIVTSIVSVKVKPITLKSLLLFSLFSRVWDIYARVIFHKTKANLVFYAAKTAFILSIAAIEWMQYIGKFTQYFSFLIIENFVAIQLIVYFILKLIIQYKGNAIALESMYLSIYANFLTFLLFAVNLIDCSDSLNLKSDFKAQAQCSVGFIYETPEMLFGVVEIVLLVSFILSFVLEHIWRILLCKPYCGYSKHQKRTIHEYIYNAQLHQNMCIICQCDFKDDYVCQLTCKCKANYHKHCICEWLQRNDECPLCKTEVSVL